MVNYFKVQANGTDILLSKNCVKFNGDFGIVRAITYNFVTDENGTEEYTIPLIGIINKDYENVTDFIAEFEVPKFDLFKNGMFVCKKYTDGTSVVYIIDCNIQEAISLGVQDYEVVEDGLIKIKTRLEAYNIVGLYRPFQKDKVLFYNYLGNFCFNEMFGEEVAEAISLVYDEHGNIIDEVSCYVNKRGKEVSCYKSKKLGQEFPKMNFSELKIIIKSTLRGDSLKKLVVNIADLINYVNSVKNLKYDDFQKVIEGLDDNSYRRVLLEHVRDVVDKEQLIAKLNMLKDKYGIVKICFIEDLEVKKEDTYNNSSRYRKVRFAKADENIVDYERPNFNTNGIIEVRSLSVDPYIVEEGDAITDDEFRTLCVSDLNLNIWNLPTIEENILEDIELERKRLFRNVVEGMFFFNGRVQLIERNPNRVYEEFASTYFSDGDVVDEKGNDLAFDKRYSKVLVRNANFVVISQDNSLKLIVLEDYLNYIYGIGDITLNQMIDTIRNNSTRKRKA